METLLATYVISQTDVRGHGFIAQRRMAERDAIEAAARKAGLNKRSARLGAFGRSLVMCGLATFAAHFSTILGSL